MFCDANFPYCVSNLKQCFCYLQPKGTLTEQTHASAQPSPSTRLSGFRAPDQSSFTLLYSQKYSPGGGGVIPGPKSLWPAHAQLAFQDLPGQHLTLHAQEILRSLLGLQHSRKLGPLSCWMGCKGPMPPRAQATPISECQAKELPMSFTPMVLESTWGTRPPQVPSLLELPTRGPPAMSPGLPATIHFKTGLERPSRNQQPQGRWHVTLLMTSCPSQKLRPPASGLGSLDWRETSYGWGGPKTRVQQLEDAIENTQNQRNLGNSLNMDPAIPCTGSPLWHLHRPLFSLARDRNQERPLDEPWPWVQYKQEVPALFNPDRLPVNTGIPIMGWIVQMLKAANLSLKEAQHLFQFNRQQLFFFSGWLHCQELLFDFFFPPNYKLSQDSVRVNYSSPQSLPSLKESRSIVDCYRLPFVNART